MEEVITGDSRHVALKHLTADLPEAACYAAVYVSAALRAVAGLTTVWMWVGHAYQSVWTTKTKAFCHQF